MRRYLFFIIVIFIILPLSARPKIGLVLSGGGAKGMAHIGMLKVIEETGLPVDCIVGTSMGAIIGGLYAMGYSADEIEQEIKKIDWDLMLNNDVPREDIYVSEKRWKPMSNYYFNLSPGLKPSLPQGFISGNTIHLELFKLTWPKAHIRHFDDLKIPFRCIGTSLTTGNMIVFEEGSLADAMRASSSLPSIFMPFEYENDLIIDGGISKNLPIEIAKSMGMDYIIALKANTNLNNLDGLKNAISVLNQTINIGMTRNMEHSIEMADIIISPSVDGYQTTDFKKADEIITIGEIEASRYYSVFDSLSSVIRADNGSAGIIRESPVMPDTISFSWIYVENNKKLHSSKVREYVNLQPNKLYNKEEIMNAFYLAWASDLFDQIYPRISESDGKYILTIVVKEKEGRRLGINLTYNNYNGLIAGAVLDFNNIIQKNSKLLINTQLGGRHALDVDYVKNFGKHYGVYFRIFPYVKEDNIFLFNNEHEKTMSLKYLEYGANVGTGLFFMENNIIEPYLYHYHINIYKNISDSDIDQKSVYSSGMGLKYYHEKVDDYFFTTNGKKLMAKLSFANMNHYNKYKYKKLLIKDYAYIPLSKRVNVLWQGEYGTYFESDPVKVDPFYIGGMDSFMGSNLLEIKTSFYRSIRLGLRFNWNREYFLDAVYNYLTWGDSDRWFEMDAKKSAFGLIFGKKNILAPLRLAVSVDDHKQLFYFISLGFDYDAFEFSRR